MLFMPLPSWQFGAYEYHTLFTVTGWAGLCLTTEEIFQLDNLIMSIFYFQIV